MYKKVQCFNKLLRFCKWSVRSYSVSVPEIDIGYYCNPNNKSEIENNIQRRKGVGDINEVLKIYNSLNELKANDPNKLELSESLYSALIKLPNRTHPTVQAYTDKPQVVKKINAKKDFSNSYKALEFSEITRYLNLMRTDRLGYTCGPRSYYFMSELAELEEALIKYTVKNLVKKNFKLISVPDILPSNVLESCGMLINNDRTQVRLFFFVISIYLYNVLEMS